jgi:hypothetical protein
MGKRVLACGGRNYSDRGAVFAALDAVHEADGIDIVIHGGAPGADSLAGAWAAERGVACRVFLADWKRDGRAAGPLRNARMLKDGVPDIVVAFPGGKGTQDMTKKAAAAGLPVRQAVSTILQGKEES